MQHNMLAVKRLTKKHYKSLDSLYRANRSAEKKADDTYEIYCHGDASESTAALLSLSVDQKAQHIAHTTFLNQLKTIEIALNEHMGLGVNIVLDYKLRKPPTLQAVIHNNIYGKRYSNWWEDDDNRGFLSLFDEEKMRSTPCPKEDAMYDRHLRETAMYGYSLSQQVQAMAEGSVKLSAQIIDLLAFNGFSQGQRPKRYLPGGLIASRDNDDEDGFSPS